MAFVFAQWFRKRKSATVVSAKARSAAHNRFRPSLESLEDRVVPSTLFQGAYAPANWAISNTGPAGSVDTSGAPTSIAMTSANSGGGASNQYFTIAAPSRQSVTFTWNYTTNDVDGSNYDPFGYVNNGSFTQLTANGQPQGSSQSGTTTFTVAAGAVFGFDQRSTDSIQGSGATTISNFTVDAYPVVTAPSSQTATEGTSQSFNLGSFSDPDGGPWNVDVNWNDGKPDTTFTVLSAGSLGTASHAYAEEGTNSPTVTVTDSTNLSNSSTFQVAVADPAVAPTGMAISAVEGASFTRAVATFTDPGGAEAIGDYGATINWGDTSSSPGTISGPDVNGVFTVTGTHTYAEESAADHAGSTPYAIAVTISHDSAPTATANSTATVSDPAVVPTGIAVTAVEGATFTHAVATFTDPGGAEAIGHYSATINWGDGPGLTTGNISFSGGVFTVNGTHTYSEEGSYTVTVSVSHEGVTSPDVTSTASVSDPAVVATAGPLVSGVEGSSTNLVLLAWFTDPGTPSMQPFTAYDATVSWGDGSTPDNTTDPVSNIFIVQNGHRDLVEGTHIYGEESPAGGYTITTTIHHYTSFGPSPIDTVVNSQIAIVSDPAVIPHGGFTFASVEGAAAPVQTVATFTDPGNPEPNASDPALTPDPYVATVAWGDGTTSTATLANGGIVLGVDGQTFDVNLSHLYAEQGTYTITTSVNHEGIGNYPVTSTATVSDPAVLATGVDVTAIEGAAFVALPVATFTDPGGAEPNASDPNGAIDNHYSASIDWGDSTPATAGVLSLSGGTFTISGDHAYDTQGSYTITIAIHHENTATIVTSTASVDDPAAAVAGGFAFNAVEGAASPTQTVATFTDPGGAEPNASDPNGTIATFYSASIDWGDSTPATAGTLSFNGGVFTVSGSHTYGEEGTYTITVTVTHEGVVASNVFSTATVSDPAVAVTGGFAVSAVEGTAAASQTVATFTDPGGAEPNASDPSGTIDDHYSASIDWGDGTSATPGTLSLSGGVFTVSGAHTYGEEGTDTITVTVTHEGIVSPVVTSTATVSDPAVAVTGGFAVNAAEGALSASQTVATFTDPAGAEPNVSEPSGTIDDHYSASIDWGDDTPATTGTLTLSGGVFTVSGSHLYGEEGTYTITVTMTHEGVVSPVVTSIATVSDPAVAVTGGFAVTAAEGALSTSQTVAKFTDPAGAEPNASDPRGTIDDHYSASIDWGDGMPATAGTLSLSGGVFTVSGAHTFGEEGAFTITVTVTHEGIVSPDVTSTATVSDPAVAVTGGFAVRAVENSLSTSQTVATFTDPASAEPNASDPSGTIDDHYSASINWGDGTPASAGTLSFSGGVFTVSGAHAYGEEGTYTITVTVTHEGIVSPVVSSTATISDPAVAVTGGFAVNAAEGALSTSQTVATFTDPAGAEPNASDPSGTIDDHYIASIDWGDDTPATTGTLTFSGGVFTVSGSHAYGEEGSYIITVTVTHEGVVSPVVTSTATVSDPAVAVTGGFAVNAAEGALSTTQTVATFTDPGGAEPNASDPSGTIDDHYSASINWGDGTLATTGTLTLSGGVFTVSGSHTYGEEGTYTITVTVTHEGVVSPDVTSNATVSDPAVVVTGGFAVSAVESTLSTSQTVATFTDPAGAEPNASDPSGTIDDHYSASIDWGDGTPATAGTLSFSSGVFTVSGAHTYGEEGTYTITVTVTHEGIVSPDVTSTATISDPAVVVTGGFAVNAAEGALSASQTVATFTDPAGAEPNASDPSGTIDDHYSASIDWGDSTPATAGTLSFSGGVFTVSGAHTYGEEGTYTVTVTVTHEGIVSPVVTSTATVSDPAVAVTGGFAVNAAEGALSTSQTVATFTDPGGAEPNASDPSGTIDDHYSASIAWGDGTPATAGTLTLSGGVFTVSGSHTYGEEGTYTITVTVTHEGIVSPHVTSTATVSDPAVAVTGGFAVNAAEGALSVSQTVATFTDPAGAEPNASDASGTIDDHYSASINWGDGTPATTGTLSFIGGVFIVSGSHAYGEEGTYAVTVTVTHEGVVSPVVTSTATVSDPAVVVTGGFAVNAAEGALSASQTVATFTDPAGAEPNASDPSGTIDSHYSASIDWGDGTPATTGTLTLSGGVFTVSGSHTYGEEGTYTITVTVTHEGVVSPVVTGTATVSDPAVAVTGGFAVNAAEGALSATQTVATFTDPAGAEPNASDPSGTIDDHYSASINWGDGTPATAGTLTLSGGVFTVSGSHTYGDEGSYTITVTVTHEGIVSPDVTSTATVSDPAVAVTGGFAFNSAEGAASAIQTVATFNDPGSPEPNVSDPSGTIDDHYSASINWGDSTPDTAGTLSFSGGVFTVSGSHTYAEEGTFTITVTVTHEGVVSPVVTSTATVSDPAVLVTGGFAINAAEGALSASQTVATFTDPAGAEPNASDPSGTIDSHYSASIAWGDGTPATAGTLTFSGGVFTVSGSHTYGEEGSYTITVTVTHEGVVSPTVTSTATVSDPAMAVTGGFAVSATEGALSSSQMVATFTDPAGAEPNPSDPSGTIADHYSASINWGDGTPASAGIITFSNGVFTVSGAHTYGEEGSFTVTVTVTHEGTTTQATSTATVSDPTVIWTSVSGIASSEGRDSGVQTLAAFTDPGGAEPIVNYSATINWGDGTPTSAGTITAAAGGVFTVSGNHAYAEFGHYTVTITAHHEQAADTVIKATATVSDGKIAITTLSPPVQIGVGQGFPTTNEIVGTFTDNNPNAKASDFVVGVYWGDGSMTLGQVLYLGSDTQGNAVFAVYSYHMYSSAGKYTFAMGVYDLDGAYATQTTLPGAVTVYVPSKQADLVADNGNLVYAQQQEQAYRSQFSQQGLNYQVFMANYWHTVGQAYLAAYNTRAVQP